MQLRRLFGNLARVYLAFGALSISAFAEADQFIDYNRDDHYNSDYNCGSSNVCCAPIGSCCSDYCCGMPCNPPPACDWAYNPPAYARCGCDVACNPCCGSFLDSFYYRSDFLWWRACEDGLDLGTEEFVESFESPTTGRSTVFNRSHSKRPKFDYDPGFRTGIGNYCACECWDFALNWTHYHTKAKARAFSDPSNGLTFVPEWERVIDANEQQLDSEGRYSLTLDLVDIEFGRKFYTSNCFSLRPQFGLRFARIYQNYRVASRSTGPSFPILSNYLSDVKSRSNFLAVGPRVGLDIELDIGCGLILFGQGAASIVFGKFDNHSRERLIDFTTDTVQEIGDFNYDGRSSAHRCSRAITDAAFGVKWNRCFEWCGRCHPVTLAFAWEHHAFFDMNNFNFREDGIEFQTVEIGEQLFTSAVPIGPKERKHGNLYTQGLTVSFVFGF